MTAAPQGRYRSLRDVDLPKKVRAEIDQRAEQDRPLPPELQIDVEQTSDATAAVTLIAKHVLLLVEDHVLNPSMLTTDEPAVRAALEVLRHPALPMAAVQAFEPSLASAPGTDVLAGLTALDDGASGFDVDRLQAALADLLREVAPTAMWERKVGFSKQAFGDATGVQVAMLLAEALFKKGLL